MRFISTLSVCSALICLLFSTKVHAQGDYTGDVPGATTLGDRSGENPSFDCSKKCEGLPKKPCEKGEKACNEATERFEACEAARAKVCAASSAAGYVGSTGGTLKFGGARTTCDQFANTIYNDCGGGTYCDDKAKKALQTCRAEHPSGDLPIDGTPGYKAGDFDGSGDGDVTDGTDGDKKKKKGI